ncbi:MAG: zinc metalloprotease HtpX [Actinomycetota bacterium]|jgi:heat shock protein HtpX|nr:zinc metalloprotease HtpX [Actinomycetota bacterium]
MSRNTKFQVDHGLTARMVTTMFLLGLVYAVAVAAALVAGAQIMLVVVIAAVFLVVQFFFSDRIALWSMKGEIVSPAQAPQLHAIVDRLCALANMPKPKVAIARSDMPNAFATGRSQKAAVLCVTSGIMRRLSPEELEAVLAHELSHVAHRDVAVMTIASFLGILAGLVTRMLTWGVILGGGRGGRNNQGGSPLIVVELAALAFAAVIYAISFLLIRALSRYRELAADRSGAILIGQPRLLANALVKVTGDIGRIPTRDLRTAQAFNAFFFAPALTQGNSVANLFATHPRLEVRLEQLAKLEAAMGHAS